MGGEIFLFKVVEILLVAEATPGEHGLVRRSTADSGRCERRQKHEFATQLPTTADAHKVSAAELMQAVLLRYHDCLFNDGTVALKEA